MSHDLMEQCQLAAVLCQCANSEAHCADHVILVDAVDQSSLILSQQWYQS